jgi:murein DD-endopeptidase MepM/ murein hydrolase activator NlpD
MSLAFPQRRFALPRQPDHDERTLPRARQRHHRKTYTRRTAGRAAALVFVVASTLTGLAAPTVYAAPGPRPDFQLPFPCGQNWRLDSYDRGHAPALDIVREPNQVGTEGALVIAPADGTVVQSFWHSNAGNVIQINHGGRWITTYLHLQKRLVQRGQRLSQGQPIGQVGHTGPTANGTPHLHFEMAIDANGDGTATWGYAGSERVSAWFAGTQYGQKPGQTYRNVTSRNRCTAVPIVDKAWVDTFANAPGSSTPGGPQTGTLNKGTNYVYCKVWGPNVQHGNDYNHWWLRTDLDTGNPRRNQYVSAYYLSRWGNDVAKDNSGTVIRDC